MTRLYNKHELKHRRQELRNEATQAEKFLLYELRKGLLKGRKFRRQYSVGSYILDFYCVEKKLCVELDGAQHEDKEQKEHDEARTRYLKEFGIKVIRFKNTDVIYDRERVVKLLEKELEE